MRLYTPLPKVDSLLVLTDTCKTQPHSRPAEPAIDLHGTRAFSKGVRILGSSFQAAPSSLFPCRHTWDISLQASVSQTMISTRRTVLNSRPENIRARRKGFGLLTYRMGSRSHRLTKIQRGNTPKDKAYRGMAANDFRLECWRHVIPRSFLLVIGKTGSTMLDEVIRDV